ncbi:MAG: hypothetical protein ABI222_01335 [Opitutaceae bacterium]
MAAKKSPQLVRNYFVLPCCLLLLSLLNSIISYKASMIHDPVIRVVAIMLLVLVGSGIVAFLVAPGIETLVHGLHRSSRQNAGVFGEVLFICVLGLAIFWLYYQVTIHGPASILPPEWANPKY